MNPHMNFHRFTPEERVAHDRAELLMSIPHAMVEHTNSDDGFDWDAFEAADPELFHELCKLNPDEINECIKEVHKSGDYEYIGVITALCEQREYVR